MPAKGRYTSFTEAREFVRSLGLKNEKEWRRWCKHDRPSDIPTTPSRTYPGEWRGMSDWLDTGKLDNQNRTFKPFEEAREFVRSLGLMSQAEWRGWAKSDLRPPSIPSTPDRQYHDQFENWRDWLGTEGRTYADHGRGRGPELRLMLFNMSLSKSQKTHAGFVADPGKWWRFHQLFRKSRGRWPEEPIEYVAELVRKEVASVDKPRVADLGCGECLLREALPEYEITGIDHVAYDSDVIACDMSRTPLEDSSFGGAVFCLSLLGHNWPDYLSEARRILRPGGSLFVVESLGRWKRMRIETALEERLFTNVRTEERPFSKKNTSHGFVYTTATLAMPTRSGEEKSCEPCFTNSERSST